MIEEIEDKNNLQKLSIWDMIDTVEVHDGWITKTLPKPTELNIKILMDKINELVITVNELKGNK